MPAVRVRRPRAKDTWREERETLGGNLCSPDLVFSWWLSLLSALPILLGKFILLFVMQRNSNCQVSLHIIIHFYIYHYTTAYSSSCRDNCLKCTVCIILHEYIRVSLFFYLHSYYNDGGHHCPNLGSKKFLITKTYRIKIQRFYG